MDRNREVRRANIVGANGFNRRRHRTNSLRDSPDEDAAPELQESGRLRDRLKKDRDRERERERDLTEKSSRNKRRRGDETSEEESLNDDEDDDGDEENAATAGGGGGVRLLTQAAVSVNHHDGHVSNHHHNHSSSFSQHNNSSTTNTVSSNHHHHLQHRKSYPPNPSSVKVSRPPPVWRSSSEMIGSLVPRKRRSASTKRSHDWMSMEQNLMQPWSSPPRQSAAAPAPPHPPLSPTSSNASVRKKLKPTANNSGQKVKPAKAAAKPSANSSNPEELEIEIAEVLYGLMTQSQAPSSKKEESRDAKSRNSSPISNSSSANYAISGSNSAPLSAVAPKRKRPREMPENSISGARSSIPAKPDADQVEKTLVSAAENGYEMAANSVDPLAPAQVASELTKIVSEAKPAVEELMASRDSLAKEEVSSSKEKESPAVKADVGPKVDSPPAVTSSSVAPTTKASTVAAMENRKEEKFEIDLMAPPPQARPSPEREAKTDRSDPPADKKQTVSISDANLKPDENGMSGRAEEKKGQEVESNVDLEKSERDGGDAAGNGNKSQSSSQKPLTEKSGHSASSLPLPMSIGSWPNGLPPMGYMAPMQGVVSMEGGPGHIPPRPKRCATHCHIARNIHYLQQLMKTNPFWPPPAAASASLFGSKPNDKAQNVAKEKISSQPATTPDSAQRKQQQQPILIQQAMPPMGPSNLMGPAFIFPLNQQQQSAASRPSGAKSPSAGISSSTTAVTSSSTPAAAVSFNYPTMASNETPYLAIVQNNGFPYPVPAAPSGYRGTPGQKAMPFPFYSAQMIHPSQLQSQLLQPHQNATASTAASASQKQQPRGQNAGVSAASPSPMSSQKTQPGREEDSPSTTDSRGSRASNMNIYGQNFTMPNFGLMTHPATTASSNHTDKKGQSKTTPDSLPPHSFAMTFGTMNGITSDMAAQNHAIFQKKNSRASDDGKSGGVEEDERKSTSGKVLSGGQSIAFAKSNPMNAHTHTHNNIQAQLQHQMQQQLKHHHQQQQQQQMAVNRSKVAVNSNESMYSEHLNLNTSSKFPSIFQQNLVQSSGSSSPSQSPQWKASARASSTTPSTTTTTTPPLKNLPQQQQQQRTQISFGGNQTSSPTTSSVSKGAAASGSPRTSSASTTNKTTPASLPAQPPNHKSPSILGNPKPSQSQQQIPKPMQQQQQLFFSNPYAQPGKSSSASYYMTRTASGGGLSLSTNDPATAIAAATANVKQFGAQPVLPAGFSYAHPVQVKGSGEQKQAAGNESLHQWQPEKK